MVSLLTLMDIDKDGEVGRPEWDRTLHGLGLHGEETDWHTSAERAAQSGHSL